MRIFSENKINRRSAMVVALAVLFVAVLVLLGFYDYYVQSSILLRKNAYYALQESVVQQTVIVQSRLEERYRILESLNVFLSSSDGEDSKKRLLMLKEIADIGGFEYTGAISAESGEADTNSGQSYMLGDRAYFKKALQGSRSVEYVDANLVDGSPALVLAIPLISDGQVRAVTFGSFNMEGFVPETQAVSAEGYSYICDSDGKVISGSDSPNSLLVSGNLLDTYRQSLLEDDVTAEDIAADLKAGKERTFAYRFSGQRRYSAYSPLGIEDWSLVTVRSVSEIDAMLHRFNMSVLFLVGKVALAVGGLCVFLIWRERRKQEEIRIEQERYRLADEFVENVLFDGNFSKDSITFNHNFAKIFGRVPTIGRLSQMERGTKTIYEKDRKAFTGFWRQITGGSPKTQADVRILKEDQTYGWFRLEAKTISDKNGAPQRVIGRISGIEDFKREVRELRGLSELDPLTGLYNRAALKKRVLTCLQASSAESVHAMLLMDVDNFKEVNDTLGHVAGDTLLCDMAAAIREAVRESDVISRLGGDEFMIFLREAGSAEMVESVAHRLCASIGEIQCGGQIPISCSIGIAMYPRHGKSYDEMYKKADEALYSAKAGGKNQVCSFCVTTKNPDLT